MDGSWAFSLGFLYPDYAAEDDYPLMGEVLGAWVRVVHTIVGGDAHEEGALKDPGDSSRLLDGAVRIGVFLTDKEDFAAMKATLDRQRGLAAEGDFLRHEDLFLQLDLKFHLTIARATGNSTVVSLMRSLFRRLEIARDMAAHGETVPAWTIDVHERTLASIRAADFAAIDTVMDEHLAQLEQVWERETGRGLVRPLPDFLQPVAERSRAMRAEGSP